MTLALYFKMRLGVKLKTRPEGRSICENFGGHGE